MGSIYNVPFLANQTCLVNNTPVLDRTGGHLSGLWNSVRDGDFFHDISATSKGSLKCSATFGRKKPFPLLN